MELGEIFVFESAMVSVDLGSIGGDSASVRLNFYLIVNDTVIFVTIRGSFVVYFVNMAEEIKFDFFVT